MSNRLFQSIVHQMKDAIDRISAALPAIKRIFAHPIIRLKDSDAILPVESVRVVNSKTVTHTAVHSELWDNITSDGLKPRALLTLQHTDNYAIYENIVFARAIDQTRPFVGKNIRIMRDMLFACHDMKFNLLERDDHIEYFLAIGKLHMAYMRDYDKYVIPAQRCLSKLLFIESTLKSRLGTAVYKKCRKSDGKITLKKTNIFRNHKDYGKIYKLMKWYSELGNFDNEEIDDHIPLQDTSYTKYCYMISLFAAGHFGFEFPATKRIDFNDPKIQASSTDWKLSLSLETKNDLQIIRISLIKDEPFSVVIVPINDPKEQKRALELAKNTFEANEYLIACDMIHKDCVHLSVFDIQSFRKIQQILLGAMIYSDKKRNVCPFCKGELSPDNENQGSFECAFCRTQIFERVCPQTEEKYFESAIKNHKSELKLSKDAEIAARQIAASMHFRNITPINEKSELICPKCKKVH